MEEKELIGQKEEKHLSKWTFIKIAIIFGIDLLLAFLIFITEYFNENQPDLGENFIRFAVDAFGLSGLLTLLVSLLNYVATKGAFDILNYSMQLLFLNIFRPKYREENFPKTYYDYKAKMSLKERKPLSALTIVGLLFLLIGIIFLFINRQ